MEVRETDSREGSQALLQPFSMYYLHTILCSFSLIHVGFLCLYGFVLISVEWFWHQDKSQDSTDK